MRRSPAKRSGWICNSWRLMSNLNKGLPGAGSRVVPPRTAEALCQDQNPGADGLLDAYRQRAKTLRELDDTVRRAEQAGYAAGLAQALEETALVRQRQTEIRQKLEASLAEVLMLALEKLLDDIPAEELVLERLRAAIRELDDCSEPVIIEVHADMTEAIQRWLDERRRSGDFNLDVSVREAEHAGLLDCRLDLGAGTIDAGLATQLSALEQCFRRVQDEL